MRVLFWAFVVMLALWVLRLQQRVRAEQMRGDMYRDISARLDRRLAQLSVGEH